MPHTVQPLPKKAYEYYYVYGNEDPYKPVCEIHGGFEGDVSPCSHFDHCERPAVIWIYDRSGAPAIFGLCQTCYDWCYPAPGMWYRVVKIAPEFSGVL